MGGCALSRPKEKRNESKSSNVEAGEAIIFSYKISRDIGCLLDD